MTGRLLNAIDTRFSIVGGTTRYSDSGSTAIVIGKTSEGAWPVIGAAMKLDI